MVKLKVTEFEAVVLRICDSRASDDCACNQQMYLAVSDIMYIVRHKVQKSYNAVVNTCNNLFKMGLLSKKKLGRKTFYRITEEGLSILKDFAYAKINRNVVDDIIKRKTSGQQKIANFM